MLVGLIFAMSELSEKCVHSNCMFMYLLHPFRNSCGIIKIREEDREKRNIQFIQQSRFVAPSWWVVCCHHSYIARNIHLCRNSNSFFYDCTISFFSFFFLLIFLLIPLCLSRSFWAGMATIQHNNIIPYEMKVPAWRIHTFSVIKKNLVIIDYEKKCAAHLRTAIVFMVFTSLV